MQFRRPAAQDVRAVDIGAPNAGGVGTAAASKTPAVRLAPTGAAATISGGGSPRCWTSS